MDEEEELKVKHLSDTFTPTPTQFPVFEQFVNFDFNDESKLNKSYLVHNDKEKRIRGWTKLMILLFVLNDNQYEEYTKSLLNLKEAVNQKAEYGYTALIIAARHGLTSKCRILINNGADLNRCTDWGSTALMFCAEALNNESNFETFKLLVDSGADINQAWKTGTSALYYAVDASHIQSIEYLIARKVKIPQDLYFKNENGTEVAQVLFQEHILPRKRWKMKPNFYVAELLLKHTELKVIQTLFAYVCRVIQDTPNLYIIDVRGLEVLIEAGAYRTPEILEMRSQLLKNLLLQAYSNLYDRQRNALRENNITKSIIKDFGNSQESLLFATTLCYMNCELR